LQELLSFPGVIKEALGSYRRWSRRREPVLRLGHGVFKQKCVFQKLSVGLRDVFSHVGDVFSHVGLKGLFQGDGVREKLRIGVG
jgi:hypothetical protein